MTSSPNLPIDFILRSFNALDPNAVQDLRKFFNHTSICLKKPLKADQVFSSSAAKTFHKDYSKSTSTHNSYQKTAESAGITGSYGFFSASCQVDHSHETFRSSTTFNSNLNTESSHGAMSFNKPNDYKSIVELLDGDMIAHLNHIKSLQDAENFTKQYGTHLITGVQLGGRLSIVTIIESGSYADKEALSVKVEAAYNGGEATVKATADVAKEVQSWGNYGSVNQDMIAIGGNPNMAEKINAAAPTTMIDWYNSVNESTVSGLSSILEIWSLATSPTAQGILKDYVNLVQLKKSIENPVIFSNHKSLSPYQFNSVVAGVDKDYKIISGGASLKAFDDDYLTSTCPQLDSEGNINGWLAESHDLKSRSAITLDLVAFAIGVYDPKDLLSINCNQEPGAKPASEGPENKETKVEAGFTLTGGGCQTSKNVTNPKFVISSYPDDNTWKSLVSDYGNEKSTALLTSFAIGIGIKDAKKYSIEIKSIINKITGGLQGKGKSFANTGGGNKVAGGGLLVENKWNCGNLAQATFPTSVNNQIGWQEYNRDLDGTDRPSQAMAFVISLQLSCTIPGVTLMPYN